MEQNERLKQIRDTFDLNMRDFSDRLGMSHGAISLLESGKRNMTSQFITSVCREFGVSEEWLRLGTGEMFAPREREDEIAEIASQLLDEVDPSIRKELVKIIMRASESELEAILEVAKQLVEAMEN